MTAEPKAYHLRYYRLAVAAWIGLVLFVVFHDGSRSAAHIGKAWFAIIVAPVLLAADYILRIRKRNRK